MKSKWKSALSLLLSFVMVMTGLTITPITAFVSNAASNTAFITDRVLLMDGNDPVTAATTTADADSTKEQVLYWKGQTIQLAVDVRADYQNKITWYVPDGITQLGENDVSTVINTGSGNGYRVKCSFRITGNADTYKITAQAAEADSKSFEFKVQSGSMTDILSTRYSTFDNRWSGDIIDLYFVTASDTSVKSVESSSADVEITGTDSSEKSKIKYYDGAGSKIHKYTAKIKDTLSNQKDGSATITVTVGESETKTLSLSFKQSASSIDASSITVTCDNKLSDHTDGTGTNQISHYDSVTNSIYLDKGQKATIKGTILGSSEDGVRVSVPTGNTSYKYVDNTYKTTSNESNKTVEFSFDISADNATTITGQSLWIATESGHGSTLEMKIIIYNGNISDGFDVYNSNTQIDAGGISLNEGATGTFETSVVRADSKEKVTWTTAGATGALTIDKDGKYKAYGVEGLVTVTATVQPTNSGKRGQTSSFKVNVHKLNPPDKIEILKADGSQATSETMYVGEKLTFKRKATRNDGASPYYFNYSWISTPGNVIEIPSNAGDEVTITAKNAGHTTLMTQTAEGLYAVNSIELTVLSPIKTLTLKSGGKDVGSSKAVIAEREYELVAERDSAASTGTDSETILWETSNKEVVQFLDDNGELTDKYVGDTCKVVTREVSDKKYVQVTASAQGFGTKSTASATCSLTVEKRVPAESVVFFVDGAETDLGRNSSKPYVMDTKKAHTFSITGYSSGGEVSNDEYDGSYDVSSASVATVAWSGEKQNQFTVTPRAAGTIKLVFKNQQSKQPISFYISVEIPAETLNIKVNNKEVDQISLKEGDRLELTASVTPIGTTDTVKWSSSDEDIVSVDQRGYITAQMYSDKQVTITAEATSGVKDSITVDVVRPIESITLTAEKVESGKQLALDDTDALFLGETMTVKAQILPANATDTYSWASSVATVASIEPRPDGSCVVTAKGQGTTIISATPNRQHALGSEAKAFKITVAKEAYMLDVTNAKGESVVDTGIDLVGNQTLTAVLEPSDSYDYIKWTALPEGILDLNVVNTQARHVCEIKKLKSGIPVTLTVSTSDGKVKKTVEVRTGTPLAQCTYDPIPGKVYDGLRYEPSLVLRNASGEELRAGTDYQVVYPQDMVAAGEKEIKLTGKGLYCDELTIKFTITRATLSDATVSDIADQTYTGAEIVPQFTVMKGEKRLGATTDYEPVFTKNTNAGTATITITGVGNYAGTVTKTFKILPKNMQELVVTLEEGDIYQYTGSAIKPKPVIKYGELELKQNTDFKITYSNNTKLSKEGKTAKVKMTGKGNFTGTAEKLFTIAAQTLTVDSVKLSKTDYVYNGKTCKPTVTVYNSAGKKLTKNKDYTVVYPVDMIEKGVKSITIAGKGNYVGTVAVEYGIAEKVTVKKPTIKSVKNSKSKQAVVVVKKVKGAVGYEITYSTNKKFTKDTTNTVTTKKTQVTLKKLKKGSTYYIKVRAYKTNSIGRMIYSSASKVKTLKIKK